MSTFSLCIHLRSQCNSYGPLSSRRSETVKHAKTNRGIKSMTGIMSGITKGIILKVTRLYHNNLRLHQTIVCTCNLTTIAYNFHT